MSKTIGWAVPRIATGSCIYRKRLHSVISVFSMILCCLLSASNVTADTPSKGFERGLDFYQKGRYDEALNEFNAEVNKNSRNPLSYYFAAHIRLKNKQYTRAEKNLLAALRDSSNFSDATGLLAFTHLKMGKVDEALDNWRTFTEAVGILNEEVTLTVDSIMLPEEYRIQLALKRKKELAEEERKKAAEKARADSIAAAELREESEKNTYITNADSTSITVIEEEKGESVPAKDLEKRNKTNIRHGIYGLMAAVILLTIGLTVIVFWIRKHLRAKSDLTFNSEIKRVLEEKAKNDEQFERDEDRAIREYEAISREISGIKGFKEEREPKRDVLATYDLSFTDKRENPEKKLEPFAGRPQTITEEVKALVTRMFKEGHSTSEIARAADLTQTEVELIVAVRARRMEQLIHDVTSEDEDYMDSDQLYKAINELNSEGNSTREIARKLDISTSEVKLALSLINMRNKRR